MFMHIDIESKTECERPNRLTLFEWKTFLTSLLLSKLASLNKHKLIKHASFHKLIK